MAKLNCNRILFFIAIVVFSFNLASAYIVEGNGVCSCNTCSDCHDALNSNANCASEVKLTADILNRAVTCISIPVNFNNKIFDCQGHTISGTGNEYGIYLSGNNGNTIKNCIITGFGHGIEMGSSSGNSIISNNINNNYRGIRLSYSSNNNISSNSVNDNEYGIELSFSSNNNISSNTANNNYIGIHMYESSDNKIFFNTVNFNDHGFWMYSSLNNEISSNTATSNAVSGIGLVSSSSGNKISRNELCSNSAYDFYAEVTGNSGDNNTCATTNNWNDAQASGCTCGCSSGCSSDWMCSAGEICNVGSCSCVQAPQPPQPDCNCSSCAECSEKLNGECKTVYMDSDIINHAGDCIYDPVNFSNKIFDCRGHLIKGDGSWQSGGVYLSGKNNVTIKNCKVTGFTYGIYLYSSENSTISDNNVSGNEDGVSIYYSSRCSIAGNTVASNGWEGIFLEHSTNSSVTGNYAFGNGGNGGGNGIVLNGSSGNVVKNNTANSNVWNGIGVKYSLNNKIINNTAGSNNETGIVLYVSENNSVVNNTANSNVNYGIYLIYSQDNSIINNTANFNSYGVYLYYLSNGNLIAKNNANLNDYFGLILSNSPNNSIINNTANFNNGVGVILLSNSSNNSIINNTANFNNYGLYSENCSGNSITKNALNSNNYGIYLLRSSNFNKIQYNEVSASTNSGVILSDCDMQGTCYSGNSNNTLQGNIISNGKTGIYSKNSNSIINSNFVCNNSGIDFNSTGWQSSYGMLSYGTNNTCDKPGTWADDGLEAGCTLRCDGTVCDTDGDHYVKTICGGSDCNDENISINFGMLEVYCNRVDENCDGRDKCVCIDGDNDGSYGQTQECPIGSDCSDNNNSVYPGAPEVYCNGIDENCNGVLECECRDNDHDGYNQSGTNCGTPDCNDDEINVHPNVNEIYCNGIDENCNGMGDDCACYDNDGDGYSGYAPNCPIGTDCRDNNRYVNPGASEVCFDNVDNNCNGLADENCPIECTKDENCGGGRKCVNSRCVCPNGNVSINGRSICDPVGIPGDTSCTSGWPSHQGSWLKINEWNLACDLFEVTRNDLLVHAEKARDCCKAMAEGSSTAGCHAYTRNAYLISGLNNNVNYDNLKRCVGMYEFYGNGPGAEFMQNYFYPEICCSGGGGFAACNGHIGKCSCNKNTLYSQNAKNLPCGCSGGCDVGQPDGWASDANITLNSCRFSDLPAHASINIISTGTCVDYSTALTTLLRMSGYKKNEIYSITGPGHEYNLIKFPGDSKYTLMDTVGNYNGYVPGDLPGEWFPYCDYYSMSCANDNGKVVCPGKTDVLGCTVNQGAVAGASFSPVNNLLPQSPELNSTSNSLGGITATRIVYDSIYVGEIAAVNITIENDNEYPVNLTINEIITGAETYQDLIIPGGGGLIASHLPYLMFNEEIPAGGKKSFTYRIKPLKSGDYVSGSTEIYAGNASIRIDAQATNARCVSNSVCDGSSGENYLTCPQDCKSGAMDGICNPVYDIQCDKDCSMGLDEDCFGSECSDADTDGIMAYDYDDLMNDYKCFLGINKNCYKINYQDWKHIARKCECFVDVKKD